MAGGGWWMGDFFVFKPFDNNMVYSLGTDVYVHKRNHCTTNVLWVLKFSEVGDRTNEKQNPHR